MNNRFWILGSYDEDHIDVHMFFHCAYILELDRLIYHTHGKTGSFDMLDVGMDETASRRGYIVLIQDYISLFFDLEVKCLMLRAEGRDQDTVSAFAAYLSAYGGDNDQAHQVCCDMWSIYIKGVSASFYNAEITFDRFHIMKIMNQAVDEVRWQEVKNTDVLKKTRFLWLKPP